MDDRWGTALAGAAAAGLALGVGELLAGLLPGVPSLVSAVGSLLIPMVPPALEDWAIATFGTSDKLVLQMGTVIVAVAIGAWVARRGLSTAAVAFASFTLLGLLAALSQPLASPLVVLTTPLAGGLGLVTLWLLLRAGGRPGPEPVSAPGRRRLLVGVLTVSATAVVAGAVGRGMITGRSRVREDALAGVEPVRRLPPPPPDASFDRPGGLTPLMVDNDDFYLIDTALTKPVIHPDDWGLRIHGMVAREVELTYSELLGMDLVEADVTLACVSNEVGGDLVGNARWLGVPLAELLRRAEVGSRATQVVGRSVDGWTGGFPVEAALDGRDALVAVGMNGAPLPIEHGFPARLVVPGLYGYVSATKWLTEIELTTFEAFDAYWVPRGWAQRAPIKTQSRIDVPEAGAVLPAGPTVVAGVAWAGHRGVAAVEVRVDDGPWQDCELTEPLSPDAWRQFRRTIELPPGEHLLSVRATDGTGAVQTADRRPPRPDGATGHHTIPVRLEERR